MVAWRERYGQENDVAQHGLQCSFKTFCGRWKYGLELFGLRPPGGPPRKP